MDIAQLGFRVDTAGIDQGIRRMDALDASGRRVGDTGTRSGGLIDRSMRGAAAGVGFASSAFTGLGGIISGLGLAALANDAVQYGGALNEVSTLVDTATFSMQDLSAAALDQSREFGTMPIANVQAFYQAVSAGASDVATATDALTAANKLAIGGVTDVLTAVDGLTSSMNAYAGSAGSFTDISDAMFTAVKAGKTTIGELSASIGSLAPLASTAGASLDEMLAATAALTKGGVSTGVAMNGLRAIVASVVKPTKEAAELAHELGLGFDAASLKSQGFAGFLQEVTDKTGGSTEKLALLFGGVEALTPIMALTGGASQDFADILAQMGDKAGATQEAFDKMINSPGFQSQRLLASISAGFLEISTTLTGRTVPALTAMADNVPRVFDVLEQAIDNVATVFSNFTDALANSNAWPFQALRTITDQFSGIGSVLTPLIPYLDEFVAALLGLTGLAVVIAGLAAAFALLTSPITLVAAAVAGFAVGVTAIYDNWSGLQAWWANLWSDMEKTGSDFMSWWDNTTFEEKVVEIDTLVLEYAQETAEDFVNWWATARLNPMIPEIVVTSIDTALERIAQLVQWWGATDLEEKAADITSIVIEKTWELAKDFKVWWDNLVATITSIDLEINLPNFGDIGTSISSSFNGLWDLAKEQGNNIMQGVGRGIDESTEHIDAMEHAAKQIPIVSAIVLGINSPSRIMMEHGKFVAQGLALGIRNNVGEISDAASYAVTRITEQVEQQVITMRDGEEAGRRYALGLRDITGEAADYVIQGEALIKSLEEEKQMREELSRGIEQSIVNADSVQDAFRNMGDFMKDWLKQQIAEFATNKIMVFLGLGDGGFGTGLSSIFASAGSVIDGFGTTLINSLGGASQAAGGFGSAILNIFGGASSFTGSIDAAQASASGATEAITGFGGALTTVLGRAGIIGTTLSAVNGLGIAFGDLVGAADSAKSGIGAVVLGMPGAIIGAAMGGAWAKINEGFQLAFREGDLVGQSFEYFEKERSLWRGTASRTFFSELDAGISDAVGTYFTNLSTTVANQARVLGVESADSVLDGFEVAVQNFSGANVEADLQEWLEESTRSAYIKAYAALGPELREYVRESVNLINSPVEDIVALFNQLGVAATQFIPLMQAAGLARDQTFSDAIVWTSQLIDAMGGMAPAMQQMTLFHNEFIPVADRLNLSIQASTASLDLWNQSISSGGDTISVSREAMSQFGLDVGYATVAMNAVDATFNSATDSFIINEAELRQNILTLDLSTEAGRRQRFAILDLINAADDSVLSNIRTRDQMYEYITSLDLTTEAGVAAYAAAMQHLDAIITVENAEIALAATMGTVSDTMRDLNVQFDATDPAAQAAANSIIDLMGGLDAFVTGAQNYMQAVYSEAELTNLEIAKNAASVRDFNLALGLQGDQMIDTVGELRTYTESLGPLTEANASAYASVFQVTDALVALEASGLSTEEAIAALPPELQAAFGLMNAGAVDSGEVMGQAADTMLQAANVMLDAFGGVSDGATNMSTNLTNAANDMNANVTASANYMVTNVTEAFTNTANAAGVTAQQLQDRLQGGFDVVIRTSGEAGESLASSMRDMFTRVLAASGIVVNDMPPALQAAFTAMVNDAAATASAMSLSAWSGSQAMQSYAGTIDSATNTLGSATSSASGSLGGFANSIGSVAGAASGAAGVASSAAGSAANSATAASRFVSSASNYSNAARDYASSASNYASTSRQASAIADQQLDAIRDSFRESSGYDGSFASGLDYVPRDGFIGELHRGEMVVTSDVANQIRALGGTSTKLPSVSTPNISVVSAQNSNNEIIQELRATRKELEELKRIQIASDQGKINALSAIASGTGQQTQVLREVERGNERLSRKITQAVS